MAVMGLDLSLRCPGVAIVDSETLFTSHFAFKMIEPNEFDRLHRIDSIVDWIESHVIKYGVTQVCIEGLSYNSSTVAVQSSLHGAVRFQLFRRFQIASTVVPTQSARKFFIEAKLPTTSEAQKLEVEKFFVKHGVTTPTNHDEYDALCLAAIADIWVARKDALQTYSNVLGKSLKLSKYQSEILAKLDWQVSHSKA
jgi:Holliday junction resolvasome RuvABC endonuclease subunit